MSTPPTVFASRDLDWSEMSQKAVQPANVLIAQAVPEGHLLNFGFAIPPVRFEDAPEGPIEAQDIHVKVVARLLLSSSALQSMIKVAQGNIETRNKVLMDQEGGG